MMEHERRIAKMFSGMLQIPNNLQHPQQVPYSQAEHGKSYAATTTAIANITAAAPVEQVTTKPRGTATCLFNASGHKSIIHFCVASCSNEFTELHLKSGNTK